MWKCPTSLFPLFSPFYLFLPSPISSSFLFFLLCLFAFLIRSSPNVTLYLAKINNSRFPFRNLVLQMDAANEDAESKSGKRREEEWEILFQFFPILGKLLRNPHFINKLIIISTSHPMMIILPSAIQPSGKLQNRLLYNANSPKTEEYYDYCFLPFYVLAI